AEFNSLSLEIFNDSAKHAGHAGAGVETHFRVYMVAEEFQGLSRVERHRRINAALAPEFARGLHALQIIAKAPSEV
ncbi:MAG: BolA family transcriptional regulator, partial [Rickettsiales bacterium]|nr:BolA family transcriptional regulator [Rickettsiales bacterium]